MQRRIVLVLSLILAAAAAGPAAAAECTTTQMLADARSVIDPCSTLLSDLTIDKARRAEALLIRGRGFHRIKRFARAAEDYAAASAIDPGNEEIWLSWSNVDLRHGDMQDYADKVGRAAAINLKNPHVLRAAGTMFWNFGEPGRALEFYAKALETDPTEAYARLFRSQLYQTQDKYKEAIADADALVALPHIVINREGYLDEYGDVLDFHTVALIHRARLFEAVGEPERAAQDYDAAMTSDRSAPALVAHAEFLLSKSDDSPQAMAELEQATRLEPTDGSAQYALGLAHTMAHRFEPAFEAFDRAVAARPGFWLALKMRARMHRQFGRTEEAVQDFMAAVAIHPQLVIESMPALRHAGFWTSAQDPESLTPELQDAIRACMIDTTCN